MATKTTAMTARTQSTWQAACEKFHATQIESVREFASEYVAHIDAGFSPQALQEGGALPADMWQRLERIGRGQMAPELFAYSGSRAVLSLPLEEQVRAITKGGIDVIETQNGKTTIRLVPLNELRPEQARIAIAPGGALRTQPQQLRAKTELEKQAESRQMAHLQVLQSQGWVINADGSAVINGVTMTRQQVARFMAEWQAVVIK